MRTLRTRLILSHTLPLLVILLLAGLALDYVVETQILLPGFAEELSNEAKLLTEMVSHRPDLWHDPNSSQAFLDGLEPILGPYVTFLDPQGELLASTDPYLLELAVTSAEKLAEVRAGDILIKTTYSRQIEASVVDVFVPVEGTDKDIIGVIRMTYHLENVYNQFLALRRVIIGVLSIGILFGASVALLLALNLSESLQKINLSIRQLAAGEDVVFPIERGPIEIRNLMRTVNSLVSRVQTMENTRRKLLANLVHELGRPLGALLPAVQALQSGAAQNEDLARDLLAGMEDEIRILRRLLNDLTGLYDQFAGAFVLELQRINLIEWLPGLIHNQQDAARVKGITWHSDISGDLPEVEADPDRLAQAIGNLVDNAIKFTPSAGMITFSAGLQENDVWIQVQDTGPGIPVEDQEFVFTAFYRGRTETRFPQGMGLGLSIARDLVTAHGGRLEFESESNIGSCFIIWLPLPHGKK